MDEDKMTPAKKNGYRRRLIARRLAQGRPKHYARTTTVAPPPCQQCGRQLESIASLLRHKVRCGATEGKWKYQAA